MAIDLPGGKHRSRPEEGGRQRGQEEGEEPVRQEMTGNVYEGAAHSRHSIHAYPLPQERTDMAERRKRKKLALRRSRGEERKWGRECAVSWWAHRRHSINACNSSPAEDPENTGREKLASDRGREEEAKEIRWGVNCLAYSRCSKIACFLPQERADGEVRNEGTGRIEGEGV